MRLLVGVCLLAVMLCYGAKAQVVREELYSFQSETLSDTDFLNGKRGTPVNIAGALRLPRVGAEKLPAVILLHGSGGMQGYGSPSEEWSRELSAIGIATFRVDSFAGRGTVETVTDQSRLGRLNMIIDAYRALQLLASHRQIDPNRIAVMGFSRGAQSAVFSSFHRFQKAHELPAGLGFAAHIGLYTPCNTAYQGENTITKPIRLLHGAADDYVAIGPCRTLVERLTKAGKDIQLIEYPDAHHVFDAPVLKEPRKVPAAVTTRHCAMVEGDSGIVLNKDTQKPFSQDDSCVEKGTTVAYQEEASTKARAYVRTYLMEVFKLK